MSDPTSEASPPARRLTRPRWLDARLLGGLVLVLVSVAAGAKIVGDAEDGEIVWAASRDLPAGSTLQAGDVEPTSIRLSGSGASYIDASGAPPDGYVLVRDVAAGELVPAAALSDGATGPERRLVSVPVSLHHYPSGLARGDRVDVYVVRPIQPGDSSAPAPDLVLTDAVVAQSGDGSSGFGPSGSSVGFVLEVDKSDVAAVVAAVGGGSIQLVGIPDAADAGTR